MSGTYSKIFSFKNLLFKSAKGERDILGKEFHSYHEIFLLLNGNAELTSENHKIKLQKNTVVVIPKEQYHQITVSGDEADYVRYVFNFDDDFDFSELITSKLKCIYLLKADEAMLYFFSKAAEITEGRFSNKTKFELIKALLILILNELTPNNEEYLGTNSFNEITIRTLTYINQNIFETITIPQVAKELNISTSYLTHTFKKDMNISLYKYILEKKLVNAYRKISSGEPAMSVAAECGFNDYSGFYKQYKKMFNLPPSKNKP